jgi:Tripartite tricarboxylate transporter family receptor
MAPALYETLGQPVVVDNRPGAAGNVGSEVVTRAAPDGCTWLIVATPNAINESLDRGCAGRLSSAQGGTARAAASTLLRRPPRRPHYS